MRKPKTALNYFERLNALKQATLDDAQPPNKEVAEMDNLPSLELRVKKILNLVNDSKRQKGNMLFFIMYDIESNKVRYNVVKYLERNGCKRIQKSIFLADLNTETYKIIKDDLTEIQSLYDNHDSIIICPISTDLLKSMKIIGKSIDIDIITQSRNTLFF
jgi:CRISPR-associated endonuclease Cas2